MKKIINITLIGALFLANLGSVYAYEKVEAKGPEIEVGVAASTSLRLRAQEERQELRQDIKDVRKEIGEKRAEIKTEVKEGIKELELKRDALKKQLENTRGDIIKRFASRMIKVHNAAVERLNKLADRIDSRIAKFEKNKNVKLDAVKAKLVIARAKIAVAKSYIDGIQAKVDVAIVGGNAQEAFKNVRGFFDISRENLKVAHSALVDVISSIKLGLHISGNATSTATTTQN